jgi:hypothetical protein
MEITATASTASAVDRRMTIGRAHHTPPPTSENSAASRHRLLVQSPSDTKRGKFSLIRHRLNTQSGRRFSLPWLLPRRPCPGLVVGEAFQQDIRIRL